MRQRRCHPSPILRCEGIAAALALFFSGCYGDFGRPRPTILSIDRPVWVEEQAAAALGEPASVYPFTDDEKLLRQYAYALIRPPYSLQRWYFLLSEYRRTFLVPYYGETYDYTAYAAYLLSAPYLSPSARYAQVLTDIRNDFARIDQFVPVALRVVDMDRKREKSLAFVSGLTDVEAANATWRVRENAVILGWVQHCLVERAASYRYVLERLVIGTPSAGAIEVERNLIELEKRIANLYPGVAIEPGPTPIVTK
jgi:hypothetical protein